MSKRSDESSISIASFSTGQFSRSLRHPLLNITSFVVRYRLLNIVTELDMISNNYHCMYTWSIYIYLDPPRPNGWERVPLKGHPLEGAGIYIYNIHKFINIMYNLLVDRNYRLRKSRITGFFVRKFREIL